MTIATKRDLEIFGLRELNEMDPTDIEMFVGKVPLNVKGYTLTVLLGLSLVAAACGGDDSDAEDNGAEPSESSEGAVGGDFVDLGTIVGDPLEHIDPAREDAFMRHAVGSMYEGAPLILGMPSLESQAYAHPGSKLGHVNCKGQDDFRAFCERYFANVFMFGMNDEVVHTGFGPMCHYLIALCVGVKR